MAQENVVEELQRVLDAVGGKPLNTVDYNARFPNQNQSKHCWAAFVEYQKCLRSKNSDQEVCSRFLNSYRALCPDTWREKFDEQVAEGNFPGQEIWMPELRKKKK